VYNEDSISFIYSKSFHVAILTHPSSVSLSLKKGRERLKKAFSGGQGLAIKDVERLREWVRDRGRE
jgi:hypothetical protein